MGTCYKVQEAQLCELDGWDGGGMEVGMGGDQEGECMRKLRADLLHCTEN